MESIFILFAISSTPNHSESVKQSKALAHDLKGSGGA